MITLNAVLAGVLAATALLPGDDDDVVRRLHVRFDWYDVVAKSCRDVVERAPEPGSATFQYGYEVTRMRWIGPRERTGTVTFSLDDVVIHEPRDIVWPGMTGDDRDRIVVLRRTIRHHEVGHVRIAEAVRDALNAQPPIVAADLDAFAAAAEARGRDGFQRFGREERAYDALTDHGRKQHLAPGVLKGPDSALLCQAPDQPRAVQVSAGSLLARTNRRPWR